MIIPVDISGKTEVYGIFGYPVKHSKSPQFQTAAFSFYKIPAVYVPFEVKPEDLENAVKGAKALNIKGLNITVPHKENIIPFLNELSEEVKYIKACNTVKNIDGYLIGYNTDEYGFITGLKELEPFLEGKNVLVLGAGGASRAIVFGLIKEGINTIYQANRNLKRVENIIEDFKGFNRLVEEVIKPIPYPQINENFLKDVDIIVNTTSVGLKDDDPWLFDYNLIQPKHTVVDIIYKETPLLKVAKDKGCKTQDGLPMLLYQGAKAFEIWTGKPAPVDIMREALLK